MSQRNLNTYRWPRSNWQTQHGGIRERQNFYWSQRNDTAMGDDRYVNYTDREDIAGSGAEGAIDDDRRSFTGVGPRNYRRDDEAILEEVNLCLTAAPEVDASEIEVFVHNGLVTLRGEIKDRRMKRRAEVYVDSVPGVTDVMNELRPQNSGQESVQ